MHMRALHPDMDTHMFCRLIDPAPLEDAKESMRRIRSELTPNRDDRHHDDTLYWLEKARDAVSEVGKNYYRRRRAPVGIDEAREALLDAENAVEDRICEYRQAWEAAKGREANDYMDDDRR